MTRKPLTLLAAVALATTACDRIPFLGGGDDADSVATDTAVAMDTTPPPAPVVQAPPPTPRPMPARALVDEPWTPVDTGTLNPGMTREEVLATWGVPEVERQAGNRTYLFYRNGCEVTCGTFDVVFLENGAVVDVIARGQGHHYSGTSSSPAGAVAQPTPASTTGPMTVPSDSPSTVTP